MKGLWHKLRRMQKRTPEDLRSLNPKRLVIIKPSALGDIVHALPVLTGLRRRFPNTHFSWVVNRSYVPLLENHRDLDELIPFDRQAVTQGWGNAIQTFGRTFRELRSRRFDVAVDLQGLLRTGLLTFATGAKIRIGLTGAREGADLFYTHEIPVEVGETHAVDRYWRVAQSFGVTEKTREFRLPISSQAQTWAQEYLRSCPQPWMIVGVGARWTTKRWPPEHFATLVNRAQRSYGGTAIFIGAPDEAPLAERAMHLVNGPTQNVAGVTTLSQLVALLSMAHVVVANDTGPLHVAVGLGRPVVAPYLCTQVRRTGPYGQADRALESSVWCQGSLLRKCDRLKCMDELTPVRLWPILQEILATWATQNESA